MKTVINTPEELSALYDIWCENPPKLPVSIEVKEIGEEAARSIPQNNAIHLYFTWLAEALSASGLDVMKTLRHDAAIPWTEGLVKALVWRVMQVAMFGTTSTTKLKKAEVGRIYDILNRHFIEKHGVCVDFPDSERMRLNQIYGDKK